MARNLSPAAQALSERITILERELRETRVALAQELSEFKPGETIEWSTGHGRKCQGVVQGSRVYCGTDVEYTVTRLLKDGTLGVGVWVRPYHHPVKIPLTFAVKVEP